MVRTKYVDAAKLKMEIDRLGSNFHIPIPNSYGNSMMENAIFNLINQNNANMALQISQSVKDLLANLSMIIDETSEPAGLCMLCKDPSDELPPDTRPLDQRNSCQNIK